MKLLITGARGQLGRELTEQGRTRCGTIQAPAEEDLDIVDLAKVARVIALHQPDVVINTAAYTRVDQAEDEADAAFAVNQTGCANLARVCANHRIPLIHISTDYVFDGRKGSPYFETDPISPLGVYGRSKARGEIEISSRLKEHIIIRTSWLYGQFGQNFVKTILKLAETKESISVVSDQFGSPTNAADLASTLLTIADRLRSPAKGYWGTYHYCGRGIISWHAFAQKIVELARLYADIRTVRVDAVSSAAYPSRSARPAFSALDCSRIRRRFGINTQPWQVSLEDTIRKLLNG